MNNSRYGTSGQRLQPQFWAEAVTYATYVYNRIVSKSIANNLTKYEVYFGSRPSYDNIKTFGCKIYFKTYDINLKKWTHRAKEGRFVGLDIHNNSAYKIWSPESHQFHFSKNVVFDEMPLDVSDSSSPEALEEYEKSLLQAFSDDPCPPNRESNPSNFTTRSEKRARRDDVRRQASQALPALPEGTDSSSEFPFTTGSGSRHNYNLRPKRQVSFYTKTIGFIHRANSSLEHITPSTYRQAVKSQHSFS